MWRAENVANYLLKGKQIYVEGRLQTRNYDDKDGRKVYVTEVVAEDVILLSGNREGAGPGEYNQQPQPVSMPRSARQPAPQPQAPAGEPGFNQGITDDDVPF